MLDWDTVRLVLAVHRAGGLNGAARELHVSLPTVSRRLSRAESDLRCVLFDRRRGRLAATEAGHVVIAEGARMERQMQQMQNNLRTLDTSMAGPVSLSIPRSLLPYCLADDIRAFQAEHPAIEVKVSASDALSEIEAGATDIVFRVEENPRPSLWGKRIAQLQFGFYVHRSLSDCFTSDPVNVAQAEGLPVVVHQGVTGSSEPLTATHFPNPRVVARCDSLEAAHALICAGMGVGRLPCLMGEANPDLREVPIDGALPTRSLWVLTHKDLRSVRRIAAFIAFIEERVRAHSELFRSSQSQPEKTVPPEI